MTSEVLTGSGWWVRHHPDENAAKLALQHSAVDPMTRRPMQSRIYPTAPPPAPAAASTIED